LVHHFEERLEAMDGKAMVVCMSRRICVDLYDEIVKLRPDWHSENDEAGVLKVIMTGSATDGAEWQQHIRDKRRREALSKRFKSARDPFKVVICATCGSPDSMFRACTRCAEVAGIPRGSRFSR
jgi:type I restriction enzyme R subunit